MTTDVEQKIDECDVRLLQYQEEDNRLRAELNRDYFANKYIEVRKVYTDLTEQQALRFEDEFIGYFSDYSVHTGVPIYNRTKSKTYSYMDIYPTYYYWNASHAIDNSDKKGVKVVQPDKYVHPKPEHEYA